MKSCKVLKYLKISRPTLCKYVKTGLISVKKLHNGYYDYNDDDVFRLMNKDLIRKEVIYCRVSTNQQKNDLLNQKANLEAFCLKNGIIVSDVYMDIGSGMNLDRKEFKRLLDDIMDYKISKIYITYKDRLSRISFDIFKNLFDKFGCEIVAINETEDKRLIEKEIFEELISIIHCFARKVYSNRRQKKLKNLEEDLRLELDVQ